MKHTPEPWIYRKSQCQPVYEAPIIANNIGECIAIPDSGGCSFSSDEVTANVKRIVQCVNACAGIEDPEAAIREAKDTLKAMILLCEVFGHECSVDSARQALAKLQPKQTP